MKKVLLTLSLFGTLLFTGCSKKNVTKEKWESHVETDGLLKYEYVYTDDSRTIVCSAKRDSNSEYEDYYKYYTKFDKDKYIIENIEYVFSKEDNDWLGKTKTVNSYSNDHKNNTQTIFEQDPGYADFVWGNSEKKELEYKRINGKDLIVIEATQYYKYEYNYDSKGNLESYDYYRYDEEETLNYVDSVRIEKDKNVESRITYNKNDENIGDYSKDVYEYDNDGNELSRTYYHKVNNELVKSYKYINEYKGGKIIREIGYKCLDGEEIIHQKTEYEYLDDGYIAKESFFIDGSESLSKGKYSYLLDKFDHQVFITSLASK